MKRIALLLLVAGCAVKQPIKQPLPPMPKDYGQQFFAAPPPAAPAPPQLMRVTLAFEQETADTNYGAGLLVGLKANHDLTTTNWVTVWTGPFPVSTNTYTQTNWPAGSWATSNYFVTITVTLTNQPADANNYRAFWTDTP